MPNIVNPAVAVAAQGGGKRKMHCIVLSSRSNFSPVYVFPYYHEQATAFASPQEFVNAVRGDGFVDDNHIFPINSPQLAGIFAGVNSLSLVNNDMDINEQAVETFGGTSNFDSYFFEDTVIEF